MLFRALFPVLLAVAGLFAPSLLAQECASDADCPAGYTCTAYLQTCPDCPPGVTCDPCDPTAAVSVCEIVPTSCATDADCDEGLICVHFTGESCPGAEPCRVDDPNCSTEPAPCETVDESWCAPPYVAPCVEDADCGPGFTCESGEVCTCVVYPDPGNGEPPPPPEQCTCEPSGESYCSLTYQTCTTDADCPEGLVCTEGGAADAAPCYVDENGNEQCPGVDTEPFCAPPGYVTPLPLEGGGVTTERADDGEPPPDDGGDGTGDGGISLCQSRQVGGPLPWGALAALVALALPLSRRR